MAVYFVMFGLAVAVAGYRGPDIRQPVIALCILFALIIGFRHEVGADWYSYLYHYEHADAFRLDEWESYRKDLGYALVNLFALKWNLGIEGVNLFCGAVLMAGIARFALTQPAPWLSLVAATPYLVIVIGMGYTRQSVAVGFELLALVSLLNRKRFEFVVLLLIGALFHRSVIVVLPLAIFAIQDKKYYHWVWIGITSAAAGYYLLSSHVDYFIQQYVERDRYQSTGALVRLMMNAMAGTVLLYYRKKLVFDRSERVFWSMMSYLSIAAVPMVAISSTAADRIGIYLMPLQLFVAGRMVLLGKNSIWRLAVVGCYFAALFVWLNFASHAFAWLPYQVSPWLM